jgi:hypothetical protein
MGPNSCGPDAPETSVFMIRSSASEALWNRSSVVACESFVSALLDPVFWQTNKPWTFCGVGAGFLSDWTS